jgi:uncharacterized protein DUF2510
VSALIAIVVIASTVWVAVDAGSFDWSSSGVARRPATWALGVFLLWIVFFPLYLVKRGSAPRKGATAEAPGPISPPAAGPIAGVASPPPPPPARPAGTAATALDPAPPIAGPPAGWYADPRGQSRLRYWDGAAWTEAAAD